MSDKNTNASTDAPVVLRSLRDTLALYAKRIDPNLTMDVRFRDDSAAGGTTKTIKVASFLKLQESSIITG